MSTRTVLHTEVKFGLPGGQPLRGCGLQRRQSSLVVGRAEVLDQA